MNILLKERTTCEPNKKDKAKNYPFDRQPLKLADNIIVEEMENKFQNYFMDQKRKNGSKESTVMYSKLLSIKSPQCSNEEMALNKELIESHQEMIIEYEEPVTLYSVADDKKQSSPRNSFRAPWNCFLKQNSVIFSWFKAGM